MMTIKRHQQEGLKKKLGVRSPRGEMCWLLVAHSVIGQ